MAADLTTSQRQALKMVQAYVEEHQEFATAGHNLCVDITAHRDTSENPDNPSWDQLLFDIRWALDELSPK